MSTARPALLVLACLLFATGAALLRIHPAVMTTSERGVDFLDADTVRRLVKIRSQHEASEYPVHELRDGFPQGATIQWSLPMDWVIRALDAVAPRLHPAAKPWETGAALAGPVLGTLAVLAFLLLALRLLSWAPAMLATLLYTVSAPAVEVTRLGNGDHQSLQLLCAVVAILGTFVLLVGRGGTRLGALTGAALGLGLWVNAESMLVLIVVGASAVAGLGLVDVAAAHRRSRPLLVVAGVAAAVALCGQLVESGGALLLEWDRVSCFQGAAVLGFLGFAALARRLLARRLQSGRDGSLVPVGAAAAVAVALVAGPFLLVPPLHAALVSELERMATFAGFCRACVAEYRPIFRDGIDLAWVIYGPLLLAIPPCVIAVPWSRSVAAPLRAGITIAAVLFGMLVFDQVKLTHMFAIPLALAVPVGGAALVEVVRQALRFPDSRWPHLGLGAGALASVLAAWTAMGMVFALPAEPHDRPRRAVVDAVAALRFEPGSARAAERIAVMAPWDLGHHLLYETEAPIVASSYQRRVDGIRASFDVLCATDLGAAHALLRDRRARWWVRQGNPSFLLQYDGVVPGREPMGRSVAAENGPRISLSPRVRQTLWAATARGAELPEWLELVYETPTDTVWWGGMREVDFRIFRIRYADD